MRFTDQVVFITGGSQGIGAAAARKFAKEGATVILADILAELLKDTQGTIQREGGRSFPYMLDVAKKDDVERVVRDCMDKFGRIDVLVHCAGIYRKVPFVEMKESEWDQTILVNLTGTFLICQAVIREMVKRKKGKVVCLASIAGEKGASAGHAHYGASKGGVIAFCKTLANELADYGIHVNCVAPGVIGTGMTQEMIAENRDVIIEKTPLRRIGAPEEVADAILFLSSHESDFITGTVLDVNGGSLMR